MAKDVLFANVILSIHGGVNGSTGSLDWSNNAHSVSLVGSAAVSSAHQFFGEDSILLNGTTDYVQCNDVLSTITADEFAFEVLFNATGFSGVVSTLIGRTNTDSDLNFALYLFGAGSGARDTLYFDIYSSTGVLERTSISYTFALNTDYLIGVDYKAGTLKIAVNNVIQTTTTLTPPFKNTSALVCLGRYSSTSTYLFQGYISARITTKSRDLTVAQTAGWPNGGYAASITLTETIVANNFTASVFDLATSNLLSKTTISAGATSLSIAQTAPVFVTISPNQGTAWLPSTVYAVNDLVFPTNPIATPYYYKRVAAGTSSATTEPTWPTTVGVQCNDDTTTNAWECVDGFAQPVTISPVVPT